MTSWRHKCNGYSEDNRVWKHTVSVWRHFLTFFSVTFKFLRHNHNSREIMKSVTKIWINFRIKRWIDHIGVLHTPIKTPSWPPCEFCLHTSTHTYNLSFLRFIDRSKGIKMGNKKKEGYEKGSSPDFDINSCQISGTISKSIIFT